MRCVPLAAVPALLVWGLSEPTSAYTVTLNPGPYQSAVTSEARDGTGSAAGDTRLPAALPASDGSAASQGGSQSGANWSLSNGAFEIDFDHTRASAQGSYSQTYVSLYFTVDEAVDYALAGGYAADDDDGRRTFLRAYLFDYTSNVHLFDNEQVSDATPDESLVLGEQGGATYDRLAGSLTGTLAAGHDYQLFLLATLENQAAPTAAPATATGSLSLSFVPEPATALLVGGGLLALACARSSERRKTLLAKRGYRRGSPRLA